MADTLTITDNRTGQQFEIPVTNGTIRALDLRQIKVSPDEFGLMTYDPAFQNTASCKSRITFIDGDKGVLRCQSGLRPEGSLPNGGNSLRLSDQYKHN